MNSKVILKEKSKLEFVEKFNIISVQSEGHRTKVITTNSIYFSNKSLKEIEIELGDFFFRIRNNVIINILRIRSMDISNNLLLMDSNMDYLIAKRKKKEFIEYLDNFYSKLN